MGLPLSPSLLMSDSKRLDLILLEMGLASTRTKAQDLIRGGHVKVNGKLEKKAGALFTSQPSIELLQQESVYVSRSGNKLEAALDFFSLSVKDWLALDVGQSTGGFTQCLLARGCKEVVGIEVGHNQLADSLRHDLRVKFWEKTDFRHFPLENLGALRDLVVMDVSFISQTLLIPRLPLFLKDKGYFLTLVKPQFELTPQQVGAGGVVRDSALQQLAITRVKKAAEESGFNFLGSQSSPWLGSDGNQEHLALFQKKDSSF